MIESFVLKTEADELLPVTDAYQQADGLRSYDIVSEAVSSLMSAN